MLKTTRSLNVSRLKLRNSNGEIIRFGVGGDGEELAKKLEKLKGQNLAKSQKLSNSGKFKDKKSKKPLKSRNSPNFNAIKTGPSFLTPNTRKAFNRL